MDRVAPIFFTILGRPEYVLAKSGLYLVIHSPDGYRIEPSPKLISLFGDTMLPSPETLVPVLIGSVETCNSELGGALDMGATRMRGVDALARLGMTHTRGAIGDVFARIAQATAETADEMRRTPKPMPL